MNTPLGPPRKARALLHRACLPLALALPVLAQDQRPAIFQDLDFEAARERAAAQSGMLILDAMTSWCGPCKQMDRTTWIDPRLEQWIDEHAVAIQLDMDEHEGLKQSLAIRAFPTIILFKDGQEFDRVVGLRSADAMLEWLGAATGGKRAKDSVLERLAELRAGEDLAANWHERAGLVEDLMGFDEFDEALTEHLWLWRHLPEPAGRRRTSYRWGTQRYSMGELAAKWPAAATAFRALRDELTESVIGAGADANTLRDWIELNAVIGDEAATASWASSAVETPAGLAQVRGLEGRLFDLLVDSGEWRTAGLALVDPVRRTQHDRADLGAYDEDAASSGGRIPAIPMGGMKPAKSLPVDASAKKAARDESTEATEGDRHQGRKSVPMIPMTAKQPARASVPMIPMGGGQASQAPAGESVAATVRRLLTEQFRRNSARRYGALLAAERSTEAAELAEVVLAELDDVRARGALLAAALRSGGFELVRERHQLWLDEIAR